MCLLNSIGIVTEYAFLVNRKLEKNQIKIEILFKKSFRKKSQKVSLEMFAAVWYHNKAMEG